MKNSKKVASGFALLLLASSFVVFISLPLSVDADSSNNLNNETNKSTKSEKYILIAWMILAAVATFTMTVAIDTGNARLAIPATILCVIAAVTGFFGWNWLVKAFSNLTGGLF